MSAPDVRERAAFEAWAKDKGYAINRVSAKCDRYDNTHTLLAWEVWQASRAALAAPVEPPQRFPIMGGPSLPWWVIAPHEAQAKVNHDQTLERLAERGGLSPTEALAVLEDRTFPRTFDAKADHDRLAAKVAMWDAPVSPAPRGEAVRHRPGHRPPVGFNAVVELVSGSELVADDVIFAEGRWLCVIDDDINDSTQVMAAEIIDDAAGQDTTDVVYGEWFARVVALVPKESRSDDNEPRQGREEAP